jgi:hypothetical protein
MPIRIGVGQQIPKQRRGAVTAAPVVNGEYFGARFFGGRYFGRRFFG